MKTLEKYIFCWYYPMLLYTLLLSSYCTCLKLLVNNSSKFVFFPIFKLQICIINANKSFVLNLTGIIFFCLFTNTRKKRNFYISIPMLSSFCSMFFQKNTFSQTHVVFSPVILVISIFDRRVLKNTALKLVRNCFDINP